MGNQFMTRITCRYILDKKVDDLTVLFESFNFPEFPLVIAFMIFIIIIINIIFIIINLGLI